MRPSASLRGDAAVLLLASKLTEAGLVVLQPVSDSLRFDLVVYSNKEFFRIQVKRAAPYKKTQRFDVPFRKVGPGSKGVVTYRYTVDDAEFLVGVVMETGDCYCFPMKDTLHVKASIQVDPRGSATRHSPRALDPEDFRNVLVLGQDTIRLGGGGTEVVRRS